MDQFQKSIGEKLFDYGLAGVLILGTLSAIMWFIVKVLPGLLDRTADIGWLRAEIDKKRTEYLEAERAGQAAFLGHLKERDMMFVQALDRIEGKFAAHMERVEARSEKTATLHATTTSELVRRLERIEERIEK